MMGDYSDLSSSPDTEGRDAGITSKPSVFEVFRDHHENNHDREAVTNSARRISGQSQLRHSIKTDLILLLNTIRLDALNEPLSRDLVSRSILNFGFRDLSAMSGKQLKTRDIQDSIKQSLVENEPRLIPGSIRIEVQDVNAAQSLAIAVYADMVGDPFATPLEFTADVDLGAGKLEVSGLRLDP
jgi:type VI secretion system protein ImpF